MANKLKRIAIGLMALSMRLDTYAMQRGLTMDSTHPKDPDPKNWRTINGSKVHLTEGKIDGGAGGKFVGKEWTGKAKSHNVLQTEGMSKLDFTKEATGVRTPKGTLGVYASDIRDRITDPAFNNFKKQYGSAQTAKLTKQEHDAVYRYTHDSESVRDYLCYGKAYGLGDMTKEAFQEMADNMSAGLSKMEHPDMWVKRGCSLMDWATKENPNGVTFEELKKMQEHGESFKSKSFLSTSPKDVGASWSDGVVRNIFVPAKARGGYIDSISCYKGEDEFLLDKETKTRIMKVEKKGDQIITYEEVVLDDD